MSATKVPPLDLEKSREHRSVYRADEIGVIKGKGKKKASKQLYNFPLFPDSGGGSSLRSRGVGGRSRSRRQSDSSVTDFLEAFMHERMSREMVRFDTKVRSRNVMMLCNAVMSILVVILWGQTIDDALITGSIHVDIDPEYVQYGLSVLTIVHILQVVEYYRFQAKHEKFSWFILDSILWKRYRNRFLMLECFVLVVHPFPGCGLTLGRYLATFLIFRLYSFFRVLRDNTATYKMRREISQDRSLRSAGGVQFSWAFAFREFFLNYPWPTVLMMSVFSLVVFSYIVYMFERVEQEWTIRDAFWATSVTMTTVGYGDIVVATTTGRIIVSIAAAGGLILASLLIFVVIQTLNPSPLERQASNIKTSQKIVEILENSAAKYIQLFWHRYKGLKDKSKSFVKGYHAHFQFRNQLLKSRLRYCRRTLSLIEMQTVTLHADPQGNAQGSDGSGDAVNTFSNSTLPSHNPDNLENINNAQRRRRGSIAFSDSGANGAYPAATTHSSATRPPSLISKYSTLPPPPPDSSVVSKLNSIEDMLYEVLNTQRMMMARLDRLEGGELGNSLHRSSAHSTHSHAVGETWSAMDFIPDFFLAGSSTGGRSRSSHDSRSRSTVSSYDSD